MDNVPAHRQRWISDVTEIFQKGIMNYLQSTDPLEMDDLTWYRDMVREMPERLSEDVFTESHKWI